MATSRRVRAILKTLQESGDSQALCVHDCLETIMENGHEQELDEQELDEYLAVCAEELAGWAQYAAKALRKKGPR